MICHGCGNQKAYGLQIKYDAAGSKFEICNACGGFFEATPDVYFKKPYTDYNLCNDDHPEPKFIATRGEKAYWLKKLKLNEAGDKVHGSTNFDKISHKHAMESLRRTKYGRETY